MRTTITLSSDEVQLPPWRAIVRGDLALHLTPAQRGTSLARCGGSPVWTVTHIPTGAAVVFVIGARAGRLALRALAGVDFGRIDRRLVRDVKRVMAQLSERGVIFPYMARPKTINPIVVELLQLRSQEYGLEHTV